MRRAVTTTASVLMIAASMAAATQWVAFEFAYHPALTGALARIGNITVYAPWEFFAWWLRWGETYPTIFQPAALIVIAGVAAGMAISFTAALRRKRRAVAFAADIWGTLDDAKHAGLLASQGIVLGRRKRQILAHDSDGHVLVTGATRSGKGVGIVVPTLLTWPRSVVVYDIKNELWRITAGQRARMTHALFFNPIDPDSARFNPLFEVRKGPHEVRDVQNIVDILVNPGGATERPDIWDRTAAQLLTGLILHVLYTAPDDRKTLAGVRDKLVDFNATIAEMLRTRHCRAADGQFHVHPEVQRAAQAMLSKSSRFRSSVQGTAESFLTLYADPIVAENTSRSDFRIGDLMCGERPMSLYLIPPPSDTERVRPLIRLMLNQIGRALMEDIDRDNLGRPKRHRLLFLLDEFPSLGRLDFFQINMGQMAGYGLKAMIVCQSFNHINRAYGRDNVIIDNCEVVTAFASQDTETQSRISQMIGQAVEIRETESLRGSRFGLFLTQKSVNQQEVRRPVLDEGQVRTLPTSEELIFVTGHPPFRAQKLRYFEEPLFKRGLLPPPRIVFHPASLAQPPDWLGVTAPVDRPQAARAGAATAARIDDGDEPLPGIDPANEEDPDGDEDDGWQSSSEHDNDERIVEHLRREERDYDL
jgi:type IV secretion system protein VirD4